VNNRQSTTRVRGLGVIALWALLALPLTTLAGITDGALTPAEATPKPQRARRVRR